MTWLMTIKATRVPANPRRARRLFRRVSDDQVARASVTSVWDIAPRLLFTAGDGDAVSHHAQPKTQRWRRAAPGLANPGT
jgi:hypothetical protein